MRQIRILLLSMFLCLGPAASCWAFQATATLTIDYVSGLDSADTPYGLTLGDTFEWTITYDESNLIGSGTEYLSPVTDASLTVSGWIGSLEIQGEDGFIYPGSAPILLFTDGILTGFANFVIYDFSSGMADIMSGNQYQSLFMSNGTVSATGSFRFGTLVNTPIPIPSSSVLFSMGLMLLFSRIRQKG